MTRYARRVALLTLIALALLASSAFASSSSAQTGTVRAYITKAHWVIGAGVGRGVLTFHGRDHPFRIIALSYGIAVGASVHRLVGEAHGIHEVSDFAGIYDAVSASGTLVGGAGVIRLRHKKRRSVSMELRGVNAGMEFSANWTSVKIVFR
jgi:hypothetical protein